MFPSGMDYARESGVAATGTVLIPTRFVWPYGGRSVYLSGSFTGWSEHFQMSPVEGCPTVFQTICSLPPGFHQYKFIVDGEWQHDERQPCVSSNYGTVNTVMLSRDSGTVMLTRDSGYNPTILSPQIPSGSSMDVDNAAFQRVVRVSNDTMNDALPRISEADLEVSRHRVSAFLSTQTAYELLPESGKVIALDVELPVKQAFHILHEQGITTAPLWDFGKGQFIGVLSAMDFILIMRELGDRGSNLTEEELETHTISAWKQAKLFLKRQTNEHHSEFPSQLVQAGPDENLKDVSLKILQSGVATVPIIHSSSEEGLYPQLLYLASLSEILKCICRYFRNSSGLLPILQLPICAIPLGTWVPRIGEPNRRPLAMLRPSASLNAALNLLVQAQVSSIPIVDDNDSLLDVYSRSDITSLAKDKVYTHINLQEMTIHQALQLGQEPYSPYGSSSQRCHMCLGSDSLHKVMERLATPGVRRLIIVEAGSKRVEGPDENLKDVSLKILQSGVATVPIIHSSSEEGLYPQLLYLASLSEILKCICRYFRNSSGLLPILQLPICAIPLGTWVPRIGEPNRRPLAMLRPSASLNAALNLLVQAQVSSIPIVDDNDSLLDVYSRSDITSLAKDKVYTHINLQEMTIHQALQLGQEPYSPYGSSSQRCHMCLGSDSLHKVMERLATPGVRRLIIVEAGSKRVEGIISLTDVVRFLVG